MEKSITKQTPAAYSDASMSGTSFRARRHQRAGRGDRTRNVRTPYGITAGTDGNVGVDRPVRATQRSQQVLLERVAIFGSAPDGRCGGLVSARDARSVRR